MDAHHHQENEDQAQEKKLHIVMFPWLAFGHLIPFLELSKCLAEMGHLISFVSTPRNLQRLLPKVPPNLSSNLNFVSFPLPHVENLPDQAEATIDLPTNKVEYLKKAYDGLDTPMSEFLETSTPDWIILDFAPHWLPPIASRLGIPSVFFSIFTASFNTFIGPQSEAVHSARTEPEQFIVPPEWIPFPSNLALCTYEVLKISSNIEENVSGVTDILRFVRTVGGCDCVAIRSCMEFESEWFNLLEERIYQKPILPVGFLPPFPPPPSVQRRDDEDDDKREEWEMINEWLDKQEKRSVVYIALGTEATLNQDELTELALGLEESKLAFFWVLRKPTGSSTDPDPTVLLPDGFQDRTKGRGFVCMSWAPQLKILGHPSVGGFLTHCGWSSVIEALGLGCPLILLPLMNDQAINARTFVWKKIGLEIERDEEDGSFTREAVAKSLRTVVVEEEGEAYRAKARELRELFGDKARHDVYVRDFANYLHEHKRGENGPI